jgi:hypothetical protein
MNKSFEERKSNLKLIRNKFLRLHKILIDFERSNYEKEHGLITSGKFLELLLGDERFAWLRLISTLIVRIDEAFDLDDGLSNDLIEGFFIESNDLFDKSTDEYADFKERLNHALPFLPEAESLKQEIIDLLA